MLSRSEFSKKLVSADVSFDLFLLALSFYLFWQTAAYSRMARSFPRLLLGAVITLLAVKLMIKAIAFFKTEKTNAKGAPLAESSSVDAAGDHAPQENPRSDPKKVSLTLFLMFCYVSFIYLIGFIAGTFIFIPVSAWLLGYRNLKSLFLAAVSITAFMYLIFIFVMNAMLPTGILIEYFVG